MVLGMNKKGGMNKIVLAGVMLVAIGGAAAAADMAAPYQAPPVPVWSWSGFYLGINAGYSAATEEFSQTLTVSPGLAVLTSPSPTKIAPGGGVFGGQVGFNWQTGSLVWGVEADWQGAQQTKTVCGGQCGNLVIPGFFIVNAFGGANSVYQKIKWFSTARAHLGWADGGALIYITGGGAWMGIDSTESISFGLTPGAIVINSAASFSDTKGGYSAGVGIEMRLWANWTAKVEYLHLDVSGLTHSFPLTLPGASLNTTTNHIRDDIVRAGLNWKFGPFGGA
jgi:outer membrane immunogenic protein